MNRNQALALHPEVISAALAAAAEANMRLSELALTMPHLERVYIRRIFLFYLETGVDFGFTREEFGGIEPYLSIVVPFSGPRL